MNTSSQSAFAYAFPARSRRRARQRAAVPQSSRLSWWPGSFSPAARPRAERLAADESQSGQKSPIRAACEESVIVNPLPDETAPRPGLIERGIVISIFVVASLELLQAFMR